MSFFNFVQYLYILFFSFIIIVRIVYSLVDKKNPLPSLNHHKKLKEKMLELSPLLIFSFLIFVSLKYILKADSFIPPSIDLFFNFSLTIKIIGLIIGAGSFILLISGYYSLRHFWKIGIDKKFKLELITGGIFKYTRNPVYSFFNFFTLSFFLMSGRLVYFIIFIILAIIFHYQILREEKFLKNIFGEKYNQYFKKTPRYF